MAGGKNCVEDEKINIQEINVMARLYFIGERRKLLSAYSVSKDTYDTTGQSDYRVKLKSLHRGGFLPDHCLCLKPDLIVMLRRVQMLRVAVSTEKFTSVLM